MLTKNGRGKKAVKREFSAGGAVFKKKVSKEGKVPNVSKVPDVEWLLIRQKGSKNWRLPKGNIEKGESSRDAAVREVWEETGIRAKPIEKLDSVRYFYILGGARIFKTVAFFLMEYVGGAPKIDRRWAHEIEEVRWFPGDRVLEKLSFKSEKEVIRRATARLERGIQEKL